MKFDYILGNPPYQEETDANGRQPPIYDKFMDGAYTVGKRVMLIHPARFLFNAGQTPKAWNKKMLEDPHFKVIEYYPDGKEVFPNADIKGGVAITYRDEDRDFGSTGVFTAHPELDTVISKVESKNEQSFSEIAYPYMYFNLATMLSEHPECRGAIGNDGRDRMLRTNIFGRISLFTEECPGDKDAYVRILGIDTSGHGRAWRYFPSRYIDSNDSNLYAWKVLVAKANGTGTLGEPLSSPLVAGPSMGFTQSFMSFGCFQSEYEGQACLKYIKSKFARTMLGVLKVTQDNPPEKWKYVPLQSFTPPMRIRHRLVGFHTGNRPTTLPQVRPGAGRDRFHREPRQAHGMIPPPPSEERGIW